MTATPVLSVRDLCVDYLTSSGPAPAVGGVSFDVHAGEVFGLAGESGSGKSTLAHAVLRLLPPPAVISGGSVHLEGADVLRMSESELRAMRWRRASIVFQSALNALNPVMTVGEQIAEVIVAHEGGTKAAATERAASLLELVGISPDRLASYPHELSGGMRQRVVIAIALALSPKLVIMDEPTTALDVVVQKEILEHVNELRAKIGFAVLFITHDLSLMLQISTRVGVMYAGRLVEVATASELLASPKHPYTQGLVASFPSLHGPKRVLTGIGGAPPNIQKLPSGCAFHPRCPQAVSDCASRKPSAQTLGDGRVVACHLVGPEAGAAAAGE